MHGQKIEKYFTSKVEEHGVLYYIEPPCHYKLDGGWMMEYDLTYLSGSDTATMNFSYIGDELRQLSELSILGGSTWFRTPLAKLYIGPDKKKWVHRYSARIPYEIVKLLRLESSELYLNYGDRSSQLMLKPKKAKKQAVLLGRIFDLIDINS